MGKNQVEREVQSKGLSLLKTAKQYHPTKDKKTVAPWAALRKEVKVFIGSFPLKHYEKLPKYASITGVLSFPLNENISIKTA